MPNMLEGVSEEWEQSLEVRDRVRAHRSLFVPVPTSETVEISVACGEENYHVLKPLAKRLQQPDGTVGQLYIPDIKKQFFCRIFKILNMCVCLFSP